MTQKPKFDTIVFTDVYNQTDFTANSSISKEILEFAAATFLIRTNMAGWFIFVSPHSEKIRHIPGKSSESVAIHSPLVNCRKQIL